MAGPYNRIGLKAAKRAAKELGVQVINRGTASGRALLAWKDAVISDLGGPENVPAAKLALIDSALVTRYVVGVVDAWILGQESLIHTRNKDGAIALRNVVLERGYVVNLLRNLLTSIGLERRARRVESLEAIVNEYAQRERSPQETEAADAPEEPAE